MVGESGKRSRTGASAFQRSLRYDATPDQFSGTPAPGIGNRWRYLGSVQANPAIHNNLCHHWLVEDTVLVQEPTPDDGEAIRVHLMTLDEVKAAIVEGRVRHSLGLSALSRVFPLWELPSLADES